MEKAVLKLVQHVLETQAAALELYARAWCTTPEDVVQEAIVQLAQQRPLPERPIGWLYCAVRRGAISAGRAESRRKRHESAAARPLDWFEPAVGEALDARAAAEALGALSLEQREVLVARLWGGLNYGEIGELVGCSSSAAHRRYAAGLAALRERLGVACPKTNSCPKS
ncbi:MAG: sigma-70 family RNA polymerase sigma factor [Planctomycetota bacterium]|nr:MAG: sigma-70 family RNA polymerase sigma factor [Planctomycetota bacterium]